MSSSPQRAEPTGFTVPDDLDEITRHPKAPAPGEPIRRHNPHCFGCGEDSPRGMHIVVHAAEGFEVTAQFKVEQWMEGGPGVIHGGLLSTAFDEVMGTIPGLFGPGAVTGHLEVDFLKPIPVGRTLYLTGRLLGKQRRKIYSEAIAHLGDPDQPVARGYALFIVIDARTHFADHLENSALGDDYKDRLRRP
ncbi:PaaI family thioesterase [Gordonia sp. ABSL1-1]|uniref:PaaI family thioesterase n=1 Tax=Gordonia sp. ABSL1-1 TaxID=3053923 RepID=UPI00257478ED|nr:PaaI family thioesterase [Gordonia sp. ABSL1-1]MDL9936152.1 PaaI family thioesterase [Gordonia sp. ABSL1-1]